MYTAPATRARCRAGILKSSRNAERRTVPPHRLDRCTTATFFFGIRFTKVGCPHRPAGRLHVPRARNRLRSGLDTLRATRTPAGGALHRRPGIARARRASLHPTVRVAFSSTAAEKSAGIQAPPPSCGEGRQANPPKPAQAWPRRGGVFLPPNPVFCKGSAPLRMPAFGLIGDNRSGRQR